MKTFSSKAQLITYKHQRVHAWREKVGCKIHSCKIFLIPPSSYFPSPAKPLLLSPLLFSPSLSKSSITNHMKNRFMYRFSVYQIHLDQRNGPQPCSHKPLRDMQKMQTVDKCLKTNLKQIKDILTGLIVKDISMNTEKLHVSFLCSHYPPYWWDTCWVKKHMWPDLSLTHETTFYTAFQIAATHWLGNHIFSRFILLLHECCEKWQKYHPPQREANTLPPKTVWEGLIGRHASPDACGGARQ